MMKQKATHHVRNNGTYQCSKSFLFILILGAIGYLVSGCAAKIEEQHRKELFEGSKAIIIDHACTDLSKIPEHWFEKAKELTIYYAHTSHGSQIVSGAQFLAGQDPKYGFVTKQTKPERPSLPGVHDAIQMCNTFGNPASFWKSYYRTGGNTRIAADTGLFNFAMFSWCGQQSSNTPEQVDQYLEALDGYEKEYPNMRFIYMTGHTDGRNRTLRRNNEIVRKYCAAKNKILFDFADIESWSPAGEYYSLADDDCVWCSSWCDEQPEECRELPDRCAHSPEKGGDRKHGYNCILKGKAFWWMMARLAGWKPDEKNSPSGSE